MSDHIKPDMTCRAETDKAIGVCPTESPTPDDLTWVPKSHVRETSEVQSEGDDGQLVVSQWIAEKKGWWHHPDTHAKMDPRHYRFARPKDY